MGIRNRGSSSSSSGSRSMLLRKPTEAMSRTCSKIGRYESLYVNSFLDFPGSLTASDSDLIHISTNMILQRVGHALYSTSEVSNLPTYDDRLEILQESADHLSPSLSFDNGNETHKGVRSKHDVLDLTNQDACTTDGYCYTSN